MSDYPNLRTLFAFDHYSYTLEEETMPESNKYSHINQFAISYLEENDPNSLLLEIEDVLTVYHENEHLSKKFNDLGLDIDISKEYWGGFNSGRDFLLYLKNYLVNEI